MNADPQACPEGSISTNFWAEGHPRGRKGRGGKWGRKKHTGGGGVEVKRGKKVKGRGEVELRGTRK